MNSFEWCQWCNEHTGRNGLPAGPLAALSHANSTFRTVQTKSAIHEHEHEPRFSLSLRCSFHCYSLRGCLHGEAPQQPNSHMAQREMRGLCRLANSVTSNIFVGPSRRSEVGAQAQRREFTDALSSA